ncbi:MAG: Ig-like domain-containing protein [Deltaproteobacteria bacterium]|nr:Ig-like domain-containing protein [Deltaproteobacteria bacterium]
MRRLASVLALCALWSCTNSVEVSGSGSIAGKVKLGDLSDSSGLIVTMLGPVSGTAITDAAGAYGFDNLPVGTYALTVTAASAAPATQTIKVRVETSAAQAPELDFTPLGSIDGQATLGHATGNAGIDVHVAGASQGAATDDAGAFVLEGVPAGTVTLLATRAGFQQGHTQVQVAYGLRAHATFTLAPETAATSTVPVLDADASTLSASPAQAAADGQASIAVTVTLVDTHGAPMAGQAVLVAAESPQVQIAQPSLTDSNGQTVAHLSSTRALSTTISATAITASGAVALAQTAQVSFSSGPPAGLVFTSAPPSVEAGANVPVSVQIVDANGNPASAATSTVRLSLLGGLPGLVGTTVRAATSGTVTFDDLAVTAAGQGYAFLASAEGLTVAVSASFDVRTGGAAQLRFLRPIADGVAGQALTGASGPLEVALVDSFGNLVPGAQAQVTLALDGPAATLAGTSTQDSAAGVAAFGGLHIDHAASGYTLSASAPGLASATSTAFSIAPGPAAALSFAQAPGDTSADASYLGAAVIAFADAFGNRAAPVADLALALASGPAGAGLSGGQTGIETSNGVLFPALALHKAGTFTLQASATGVSPATSAAFTVSAGAQSGLAFLTQPQSATAGNTLPTVRVGVGDKWGNAVSTSASGNVFLSAPFGSYRVGLSNGVANFGNVFVTQAGTFTFTATFSGSPALASATSASFTVQAGPPSSIYVQSGLDTGVAGEPLTGSGGPIQVAISDDYGNPTPIAGQITVALGQNPTGDALAGTLTATLVGGIASFDDLVLTKANPPDCGSTLVFHSTVGDDEEGLSVIAGAPTHLAIAVDTSHARALGFFSPALSVEARDRYDNVCSSDAADAVNGATLSLSGGTVGARLFNTSPTPDGSGLARVSFPALTIDRAGTAYVITATPSGGGDPISTPPFDVGAGTWQASTGIEGGSIGALFRDTVSGALFAGAGSVLFKSTDSGTSWSQLGSWPGQIVKAVAADPHANQKLYVLVDCCGQYHWAPQLWRSLDAGATWRQMNLPQISSSGTGWAFVPYVLHFSSASNPSELYVAVHSSGLQRTTDDAQSFTTVHQEDSWAVAVSPTDPNIIYVSDSCCVRRSSDHGATFTPANYGLADSSLGLQLVLDPNDPQHAYFGTNYNGFYVTANALAAQAGQVVWTKMEPSGDGTFYNLVAPSQHTPGTVYLVNQPYTGVTASLYKSTDYGATWSASPKTIPFRLLSGLAEASSGSLFFGADGPGVQTSSDEGTTWAPANGGITGVKVVALAQDPTGAHTLYAGTSGAGVFKSTDGGQTWSPFNTGLGDPRILGLAVAPDGSQVYAMSFQGTMARRGAASSSWSASAGVQYGESLAVDATDSQVVWGYGNGQLYRSVNQGASFTSISNSGGGLLLSDPVTSGRLLAIGGPCLLTTNAGASVGPTGYSFSYQMVSAAMSPVDGNVIWGADTSGTFHSTNAASSFSSVSGLPAPATAFAPDVSSASATLAASPVLGGFGSIYSTANAGSTWSYVGSGLANAGGVRVLLRDRGTSTTVYAGTDSGVFRATNVQ